MISSLNFSPHYFNISFKGNNDKKYSTKPLDYDTFVKSKNQVSKICNVTENEFINWANSVDFVNTILKDSICDKNLIGKGFSHSVYKISSNDDYLIRVSNNALKDELTGDGFEIIDAEDRNLKGNFGQCVAKLVNQDLQKRTIEVMLKQNGIANGNPPPSTIYYESGELKPNEVPYEDYERKYHFAKCIEILANMPQATFDKLVEELDVAGCAGYKFDYYNPNNFLLDEDGDKISIIDLEYTGHKFDNDYGNALYALCSFSYLPTFLSSMDNSPVDGEMINYTMKNLIQVIDKYTKALKNNNKHYTMESRGFVEMLSSIPMMFYLKERDSDKMLEKLREMGVFE